jgi:hypothetical protein
MRKSWHPSSPLKTSMTRSGDCTSGSWVVRRAAPTLQAGASMKR